MSAARALFARLIDHAPTFPPAQLPVDEALAEDRRAQASDESWILARLAWPASKLAELPDDDREITLILDRPVEPWPVPGTGHGRPPGEGRGSSGGGNPAQEELPAAAGRLAGTRPVPGTGQVRAVEGRGDPQELAGLADEVYVEGGDLDEIARLGLRAKVRCGGERVPSVDELADFVRGCRERDLPFKATAGLHHAVRRDGAHGFLNVLAAAVFAEDALAEEDPEAFRVTETAFHWRDRAAPPDRGLFVGFGSCSFFEPVDELKALGLI